MSKVEEKQINKLDEISEENLREYISIILEIFEEIYKKDEK